MLGPYELNQIYTGDARELAKSIPDESVDLIFTDPVYWHIEDFRWVSEIGSRILKPGGSALVYSGMLDLDKIIPAMSTLNYCYVLIERKANARMVIWKLRMFQQLKPLLWFSKGNPIQTPRIKSDFRTKISEGNVINHEWSKGLSSCFEWLSDFTSPDSIVFDPFTGGGTVPAVCKMLGRNYLAFEIDPATADLARQRVAMTQPPLFVVQPEQLELAV